MAEPVSGAALPGVPGLLVGVDDIFLPGFAGGLVVVADLHLAAPESVIVKSGAETAGLHDEGLDAQGRHLPAQAVRHRLQRCLGGSIVAAAQAGRHRADGGHVYNDAVLLLPHGGQHQLYQLNGAEEIGLEQFRHHCRFPFLQGCPVTVARVVDEHINRAKPLLGLLHRLGDGLRSLHVQGDGQGLAGIAFLKILHPALVPGGDHSVFSLLQHRLGDAPSNAGGTPGDEPCACLFHANLPF